MTSRLTISLLAAAGGLALGACSDNGGYDATKRGSQPMAQAAPAAPLSSTPAAYSEDRALAYDGYALAERAHSFDRSVQSRRPDYAFRYDDEEPLVWRTGDDYSMYAEPYDGGYRNYYYAPGADHPYFARDREYGYGYGPDGRVRAVYDSRGALVSGDSFVQLAAIAAGIYLRAHTVRRYGEDARYRVAVEEPYWAERRQGYYAWQAPWIALPERAPAWRDWRRDHAREIVTFVQPRHDNGRHLGWAKQAQKRAEKAERRDDRFARAYAPAVVGVPAAGVVRARGDDGGKHEGGPGRGNGKGDKHGGEGKGHDKDNGRGKGHDKD